MGFKILVPPSGARRNTDVVDALPQYVYGVTVKSKSANGSRPSTR